MMNYRSKWTRHNILCFIDENYPEISFKLMGLNAWSRPISIGNFSHNKYGRLYAKKVRTRNNPEGIIVFHTEKVSSKPFKGNKAFMNEWIKNLNKKGDTEL